MKSADFDAELKFDPAYWQVLQTQLSRLTAAGLEVSRPRPYGPDDEHEFAFSIAKPRSTPGNSIPDKDVWCGYSARDERESDAPGLLMHTDNGQWVVFHGGRLIPGPDPDCFRHVYDRLDHAIPDVLDYYFGDPRRVRATWEAHGLG